MDSAFVSLLGIAVVAFLVPFTLGFFPRLRLPAVVVEVIAGIIVGPAVLSWVHPTAAIDTIAELGVGFLLFLAGMELNLGALKGGPARNGSLSFGLTFALALLLAIPLGAGGLILSPLFVAIALSATSVGIIVPVLRDTGRIKSGTGLLTVSGGAVAEFATIALLGVFFARGGSSAWVEIALMAVLSVAAILLLRVLQRASMWEPGRKILDRLDESTSQPRVRLAVLVLVAAATLSLSFGFEAILGTFLAGIIFAIVIRGDRYEEMLRVRIEAIGFGLFVPAFFITSGLRFDASEFGDPAIYSVVALFFAMLLLIHVLPPLIIYTKRHGPRTALGIGLLQATNLSFLVVAVELGRRLDKIDYIDASALVIAGLLSAIVFPALAHGLLGAETPPSDHVS